MCRNAFNQHVISRSRDPNKEQNQNPQRAIRQIPDLKMADGADEYGIPQPIQHRIGCQELLEMKCTHCGWLRKRRTLNLFSWPQAYVVIYDGCMYYFSNERAKSTSGKFSLYGYNAVYRASEISVKEAPWCFKIVHSHPEFKTYYFAASSEQEMKVWMSKIKQEMLHANGKSAIYGRNLQFVKEEKPDKSLEDPSFYQRVEENIYDDTSKFVPDQDYQKQYSVKKNNEDSDPETDEDEQEVVNPSIDDRPPIPLPHTAGPFITLKPQQPLEQDPPTISVSAKVPKKPPRLRDEPPAVPSTPPPRRRAVSPPPSYSHPEKNKESHLLKPKKDVRSASPSCDSQGIHPNVKRKGSYEKMVEGPGSKSPLLPRRFEYRPVLNTSGGGSTGDEDMPSDAEDDHSLFYFDDQDKYRANEILQNINDDGVYLVRPENNGSGKVLVVCVSGGIKKYRINHKEDEYFLATEGYHHRTIEGLLRYYYHNSLPTVDMKLKKPYKNHPKYKDV